jgi:hypothetical protein
MIHNSKKIIISVVILFFLISSYVGWKFFVLKSNKPPETYVAEIKDAVEQVEEKVEINKGDENTPTNNKEGNNNNNLPDRISINVPFTSQAPFGVWDARHEEACEEASLIMLKYYLDGKPLAKDIAEAEIQKMIDFEVKTYGDYKDTTVEQTLKLAKDFYGINNLKAVYDFKADDLKKELAKNQPIIVPAAGRELGNPNFTAPGPIYHNLVLTGYSGSQIITNDPGTRKGQDYRYNIDILYSAIHDFPGDLNKIDEGRKAMIVIR